MSQGGILQDLTTPLADVETLTGDTGGVISPDAAHNIDILGGEGINTVGTANTITISGEDASTTNKGILETATDAEAVAHSVSGVAVVPSNLDNVFAEPPALGGTTPNTGNFTLLDVVGSGAGAQDMIDITPAAAIGGVALRGIHFDASGAAPSTSGATIRAIDIDNTSIVNTNDPHLNAIRVQMPASYSGFTNASAAKFEANGRNVTVLGAVCGCAFRTDDKIRIDFDGSAFTAVDTYPLIDVNIDSVGSTGGDIHGLEIAKVGAGSVAVAAIGTYSTVDVIHQHIGTFAGPDKAWKYDGGYTDVTTEFGSSASDVQILASKNDIIYVGGTAVFDEIECLFDTVADKNLILTFEYSIAGPSWTPFSPSDGTLGFANNGIIAFASSALSGWASVNVNGTSKYYIRITRGRGTAAATTPTEDTIKILAETLYGWDSNGDLTVNELKPVTDLAVQYGGTGTGSLTDHGVLVGSGTSAVTDLTVGTDGQLLVGSSTADPVFATVTAGIGLVTTLGAGTFQIDATGGGINWTVVTGATAGAINNGYICNNAGTRVVVTLPDSAVVGSIVRVAGLGAAGWGIAQNASEFCHVGNTTTTTGTGGKIESTHENDCIELVCIVADTQWLALSTIGNLTIT